MDYVTGGQGNTKRPNEAARCLTRSNTWQFACKRGVGWRGVDIERLLWRYHVRIFDRGFTKGTLTFRVARRQANWAEYLMCRAGISLVGEMFNPGNATAYARYQGILPPRWEDAKW